MQLCAQEQLGVDPFTMRVGRVSVDVWECAYGDDLRMENSTRRGAQRALEVAAGVHGLLGLPMQPPILLSFPVFVGAERLCRAARKLSTLRGRRLHCPATPQNPQQKLSKKIKILQILSKIRICCFIQYCKH